MKKITYLLLMLFAGISGAWATDTPYNVGTSLSSTFRAGESDAYTLSGDGTVSFTFINHVNPDNDNWYNWQLFCTNTNESAADGDNNSNRYFRLRADWYEEIEGGNTTITCSEDYDKDFMSWSDGCTSVMTITRLGSVITVNTVSTKGENTYTYNYRYTLADASATTKFFLVNGNQNYLEILEQSSQKYDYSTLYSRTIDEWSSDDVAGWGGSTAFTATAGTGLVGTSLVDTENNKGGNSYDGTVSLSPNATSIVTMNAELHGATAPGRSGSYDYLTLGGVSLQLNAQDKVATIVADGVSTTLTGFTRDADYNVTFVYDGALGNVDYTITGGITASGSVKTTQPASKVSLGHYKAGREGYTNTLTLKSISITEVKQEVTTADYTVNYKHGGTTVKTVSGNMAIGATVTASRVVTGDDAVKYLTDDATLPSLVIAEGSNVLDVNVHTPRVATLNVTTVVGTEEPVVASTTFTETDDLTCNWSYVYPAYKQGADGIWYKTESTTFGEAGTFTTDGEVIEKTVNYGTATSVSQFIETNDMTLYKTYANASNDINYSSGNYVGIGADSGGNMGYMTTKTKIPAGEYGVSVRGTVRRANDDLFNILISTDNSNWTNIGTLTMTSNVAGIFSANITIENDSAYVRFENANGVNTNQYHYVDYVTFAPVYEYSIKAMDGETELTTIASGKAAAGTELYWSKCLQINDKWYDMPDTYATISATASNDIKLAATVADIQYFIEAEDMTLSRTYGNYSGNSASAGKAMAVYSAATLATTTTIAAGTYKFGFFGIVRRADADSLTVQVSTDNETWTDAGYVIMPDSESGLFYSQEITLDADSYVRVVEATTNNMRHYIDYMVAGSGAYTPSVPVKPTAISNVNAEPRNQAATIKVFKGGKFIIVKNGAEYTAAGQRVK